MSFSKSGRMTALGLVVLGRLVPSPARAQSQATDGAIEGTITDSSGAVLPGVTVTITNTKTGTDRVVVTNDRGLFHAPLLPLGTYKVSAELQGFKRFEKTGITLSVGQTAVVNASLNVGQVSETVSVNAADAPPIDTARIDIGHTLSDTEVHHLPLSRAIGRRARSPARRTENVGSAFPGGQRRVDAHQPHDRRRTSTLRKIAPVSACCRCLKS